MLTREEVVEIMTYCQDHGVSYKSRLVELNIPLWRFYESKSHYAAEQSSTQGFLGEFIELPHVGSYVPVPSFACKRGRRRKEVSRSEIGQKRVEIRTNAGAAILIQGSLSERELYTIIKACGNVQP